MDQIRSSPARICAPWMKEVNSAEKLINDEIISFDSVMKRMKAEPVVMSVFRNVDTIREREVKKP